MASVIRSTLETPEHYPGPDERPLNQAGFFAVSPMQIPDVFAQIRPLTQLLGTIVIVAGLLDFVEVISLPKDGLHIAFAGWLTRNI